MLEWSRRLRALVLMGLVGCGSDPTLPPHGDAGPAGQDGPVATGGTTGEGGSGGSAGRGGAPGTGGSSSGTGGAGGLPGMGGMSAMGGTGGPPPMGGAGGMPPPGGMGGMMMPPVGGMGGLPPMGGMSGTMMPPMGGMSGGVSCGGTTCQAGQVCCPSGLPCANMCVPDCRLGGGSCPMAGLTCSQSSGVCMPSGGMGGMGGMTMPPMGGMGGMMGMGGMGGMPMGGMMGMGGMATGGGGTTGSGGSGGSTSACRTDTFVDLTTWLPDQNAAYDDPTLSVSCSGSTMTVTSNSVPQYEITWPDASRHSFANTLVVSTSTYQIPRTTVFNAVPKQATVVGGVGVAVNGIQISSPSASGGPLQYADPAGTEVDSDTCEGHPNPSGHYHYHALRPSCLFKDAEDGDLKGSHCTKASPIIGWIADGYPMYGPCECLDAACTQVVEMRSSWKLQGGDNNPRACAYQDYQYVGDASGEESDGDKFLDQCNGHYGPKGDYHYHMTNEYPWTLRCYRGSPMATMTMGHTYDASAGKNDCCFEKECKNGVYQSGVNCMMASCVP